MSHKGHRCQTSSTFVTQTCPINFVTGGRGGVLGWQRFLSQVSPGSKMDLSSVFLENWSFVSLRSIKQIWKSSSYLQSRCQLASRIVIRVSLSRSLRGKLLDKRLCESRNFSLRLDLSSLVNYLRPGPHLTLIFPAIQLWLTQQLFFCHVSLKNIILVRHINMAE